MGKTRDLFKKIRDTKGTFHAKIGLIKDRNGKDLTEAEDMKKRHWGDADELENGQAFALGCVCVGVCSYPLLIFICVRTHPGNLHCTYMSFISAPFVLRN